MLTIGNTGAAAGGVYDITITGTGGGKTRDAGVQLTLYSGLPAAPALVSPADGATLVALQPTLQWDAVAEAADYFLEVAGDPGFGTIVYSATSTGTSHTLGSALGYSTTYYWRVQARNICGDGAFSTVWSFTTLPEPPADKTVNPDNLALDIFMNCDTGPQNGAFQVMRVGTGQAYAPSDRPGDYGIFRL